MSVYSSRNPIAWQNVKMIIPRPENRPVRIYVEADWKNEILRGLHLFFLYVYMLLFEILVP